MYYYVKALGAHTMEAGMGNTVKKLLVTILATLALVSCASKTETNSSNSLEFETSRQEDASSEESTSSTEQQSSSESLPSIYKVTFQNYDGTVLYETEVEEGHSAEYVGETPTKPVEEGKVDYTYEFVGWDKELENILEDTIATAMFKVKTEEGWGDIVWF